VADVKSSIFNLIAATLGAGTIAFPYAIMQNGIFFGTLLIILAGFLSYDSGMMIIKSS
jgi:amino acid permease